MSLLHRNELRSLFSIALMMLLVAGTLAPGFGVSAVQASPSTIRFGVQPWPGLVIKTQIVGDLLTTMGYKVKKSHVDTPIVLHSLATGHVDVSLGGWSPGADYQIDPLVKEGKIIKLAVNVHNAVSGLAVPSYVHEAGVDRMKDLNRYAAKFDHKIYGIEPGSSANAQIEDVIKENRFDLGDWKLVSSSTAAMLTAVKRKIDDHQWIVFYAWKPHWMNKAYDLYYLKSNSDFILANKKSSILTLVSSGFVEKHPNVTRMLKQIRISPETQTKWIYDYAYKNDKKSEITHNWIATHLELVRQWLDGVKTASGAPAFAAVKSTFGSKTALAEDSRE